MIKEIVLNEKYGGFGLSWKAVERLQELDHPLAKVVEKHDDNFNSYLHDIERDDPLLVQIVRELGDEANGECSNLVIRKYHIDLHIEYEDGYERANYVSSEVWWK